MEFFDSGGIFNILHFYHKFIKELIQRNSTELDCAWNKQITSEAAFKSCPNVTKALHYTKKRDQRSGYLEPVKESLSHILSTNGEVSIYL